MKPRKMQPVLKWAVVNRDGVLRLVLDTRYWARMVASGHPTLRVVRVRVTEAP